MGLIKMDSWSEHIDVNERLCFLHKGPAIQWGRQCVHSQEQDKCYWRAINPEYSVVFHNNVHVHSP